MSGYRTIIFDLDGTLVHSAPDLHVAANRMLDEFDRPSLSLAQVTGLIGNGVPKLVERCLEALAAWTACTARRWSGSAATTTPRRPS
jgi:phosphoglycolate phosphatase